MNFAKKKYSQKKKLLPVQLPLPLSCRTKCIKRHVDGTLVSSSLGSSLFQIQWKIVNSGYSIIDLSEIFISTFSSSFRNNLYISWKKIKRAIFLLFVTFHYDLSFFFFFWKEKIWETWNFTPAYNKTQPQLDIVARESLYDQQI